MAVSRQEGYFGEFGGRYIPETLSLCLKELEQGYYSFKKDKTFCQRLNELLNEYAGRPTPLYYAASLSRALGAKIYIKREDLLHTGAHKINNSLGQALLAKFMGKGRIIAETGAGQHGVATATAATLLGLDCDVYMGARDIKRQSANVFRMKILGARVIPVTTGSQTLKDACNQAFRDWVTNLVDTHYLLGSAVGPHPYPKLVRDFQSVIGRETRKQILQKQKKLPDYLVACVGGGSNAIGFFHPFFKDNSVKFIGVEASGLGLGEKNAASLSRGKTGIFHGSKSYVLQDQSGQIKDTHSIAAGLDYPGVGPEHSFYKSINRAKYVAVSDKQALEGFGLLSRSEGIIPALEPAHAVYYLKKLARDNQGKLVVLCLSGRGDKDLDLVRKAR